MWSLSIFELRDILHSRHVTDSDIPKKCLEALVSSHCSCFFTSSESVVLTSCRLHEETCSCCRYLFIYGYSIGVPKKMIRE